MISSEARDASTLRSRVMCNWTARRGLYGGSASQMASARASTGTARPGCSSSAASSTRCLGDPTSTNRPFPRTSNGPSSRNSTLGARPGGKLLVVNAWTSTRAPFECPLPAQILEPSRSGSVAGVIPGRLFDPGVEGGSCCWLERRRNVDVVDGIGRILTDLGLTYIEEISSGQIRAHLDNRAARTIT